MQEENASINLPKEKWESKTKTLKKVWIGKLETNSNIQKGNVRELMDQ